MAAISDTNLTFWEWDAEPNHVTLLTASSYKIFAGHLPAHGKTFPHAHRRPTVCISLLSASHVKNTVHSPAIKHDENWIQGVVWPRGALFTQMPDPNAPYIHTVQTSADPVLFVCAETNACIRRTGEPAPAIVIEAAPGVSAIPGLQDSTFASGTLLTLQEGAAVELRSVQTHEDRVLVRLICWVGGPDLRSIQVHISDGLSTRLLEDKEFDPLIQAMIVDGFDGREEAICTLHNLSQEPAELAVIDLFAAQ